MMGRPLSVSLPPRQCVTEFLGVVARVAGTLFATEAILMLVFELLWPYVRTWHHLYLDTWLLAMTVGLTVYCCHIRPLDRRLNETLLELDRARNDAEQLSRTDPLTGLLNRREFFAQCDREWHRSARKGSPLSCIMLDLDFFKSINDGYGHLAGDAALRGVGHVLQAASRSIDAVCRYGGEEFAILLPETDLAQAAIVAERLRQEIADISLMIDGNSISLTASLGIATRGSRTASMDELIHRADSALMTAKCSGRNRVERAAHSPHEGMPQLGELSSDQFRHPVPVRAQCCNQ
jgi:diguanylate cyclase (GGDEF)-like protein